MLNKAIHQGNIWESGGICPSILDLSTRWRWVVSFSPGGKSLWSHKTGSWVGPSARLDNVERRKISAPAGKWTLIPWLSSPQSSCSWLSCPGSFLANAGAQMSYFPIYFRHKG
jgi:hypothetical protein